MKATDLMIGDCLIFKSETPRTCKVVSIDTEYKEYNTIRSSLTDVYYTDDCFEPIPLTPEILEKNGFIHVYTEIVVSKYYKHIVNEHGSTAINVYFEKDMDVKVLVQIETNLKSVSGVNSFHSCEIEHVHTFQHALRLCGLTELADIFKIE